MSETSRSGIDEVDLLMDNARLRDELEPYRDDSIDDPSTRRMPLVKENEYLASILAWERAPALPIANWFQPPLSLPPAETLDDESLTQLLLHTIDRLYAERVVLKCTDHLSDRELFRVIRNDILPCCEKKVDLPGKHLEWRCVEDQETWLRFYASAVERRRYQEEYDVEPPAAEKPRFKRELPGQR